jgi:hypothetical protein
MNEMVSWALVTLPSFGGASSCRLHCPGRCQESAMPSFQIRVAAAHLSATISAPIFAQEIQAKVLRQSLPKPYFLGKVEPRLLVTLGAFITTPRILLTVPIAIESNAKKPRLEDLANACSTHPLADVLLTRQDVALWLSSCQTATRVRTIITSSRRSVR